MAESVGNDGSLQQMAVNYAGEVISKLKHSGTSIGIGGPITFPADLEGKQEAIRFEFFREYQFDRRENKKEAGASLVIYLPIPQNLKAAYSVQYEQSELGVAGLAGARLGAGQDVVREGDIEGGTLNLLAQGLEGSGAAGLAAGILGKLGGLGGVIAGAGAGTGLQKAVDGALMGAGTARNPHMAQVFKNVQFRSHELAFKLAPKNVDEQNRLKDIIKAFKIAMHPNYKLAGHFFDYPGQFDIDLVTGQSDEYFFNMGPSVLTGMSVDYLPNGPQVHDINGTKAPIAVNLSLTFTELQIVTQREIKEFNY